MMMQHAKVFAFALTTALLISGCNPSASTALPTASPKSNATTTPASSATATPATTQAPEEPPKPLNDLPSKASIEAAKPEGGYAQLLPPQEGEEIAVVKTSMGTFKLRFFPQYAPKAVENFVTHAKNGYYNGVVFHRVLDGFMIQSGDPQGDGTGGESIWNEDFDLEVTPQLHHIRGAISMANTGQPKSNGSQFFVVQNKKIGPEWEAEIKAYLSDEEIVLGLDEENKKIYIEDYLPNDFSEAYLKDGGVPDLDFKYTVFGQCFSGMDVVDAIAAVEVKPNASNEKSQPVKEITIESITIEPYKK